MVPVGPEPNAWALSLLEPGPGSALHPHQLQEPVCVPPGHRSTTFTAPQAGAGNRGVPLGAPSPGQR